MSEGNSPGSLPSQVNQGFQEVPQKIRGYINMVRGELRDYAALNRLSAGPEHSDRSIGRALIRAAGYWNETTPVSSTYSVANFPYPNLLIEGAIYYLLKSLGYLEERNRLSWSDGQVSMSLSDRRMLEQFALKNWAEFKEGVKNLKLADNLKSSMTGSGVVSEYGFVNDGWIEYL